MTFDLGYIARQKKQGPIPSINAVGGLEYQREINGVNYKIHEFTSTNVITFQIVPGVVDCFLLGGGGGAGSSTPAGGGGAGGIITATNLSVLPNVPYIVTVGAGGTTGNPGNNGIDSSITFNGYKGHSYQFDGSNDFVTVGANTAFSFGTEDFTVELWAYSYTFSNSNGKTMVDSRPTSTNGAYWIFGLTSDGRARFTSMTTGGTSITAPDPYFNQWVHYAATRQDTDLRLFANGILVGTATDSSNISSSGLRIGTNAFSATATDTFFYGFISNLKIVKGTAIYTDNFTPSTAPLSVTTGTSLLTAQDLTFVDNSANNFSLTAQNGATTSFFSPFTELSISAQGGGGGGSSTVLPGRAGASGGGAGATAGTSPQSGGAAILLPVRQGYPGGAGTWQTGTSAGGGGGFTQAGVNASSGIPGRGGNGITLTFTGVLIDYAGGGNATGASGAGLAGGSTANRGGGGNSASNGGSGIVYIRYPFNPN